MLRDGRHAPPRKDPLGLLRPPFASRSAAIRPSRLLEVIRAFICVRAALPTPIASLPPCSGARLLRATSALAIRETRYEARVVRLVERATLPCRLRFVVKESGSNRDLSRTCGCAPREKYDATSPAPFTLRLGNNREFVPP
eukprot:1007748-Rhodomonas_salina.1